MNDQTARSAGRLAAAIAVPVALVTGFAAFQLLRPAAPAKVDASPSPAPQPVSTAPVSLDAIELTERGATVCRDFVARLPEQLRGLPRRRVIGAVEQGAAFGDPPVTLACGGAQPTFEPTDLVYPINGVCWHPNQAGSVWTTVDREVPVALALPASLSGEGSGQWAAAVSGSVAASVPASAAKPGGCP